MPTWLQCLKTLESSMHLSDFSVWIKPLKAQEKNNNLVLLAPNPSALKHINKNLKESIIQAAKQHNKDINVSIKIATNSKQAEE